MKALKNLKKLSFIIFALVLLFLSFLINKNLTKPFVVISKQEETWNLNNEMLAKFNLGFKRMESSLLWISTILESDQEHYKKKDLNSWMFLRFNSISTLEPLFYENYSFGGMYLSIIKDDIPGASIIYNKGLKHYGNDYELLRDAGFHFYFEAEDYKRAYEVYSKLSGNPKASPIVISSLARLEKAHGKPAAAFELLFNKYSQLKDKNSAIAKKIELHLYGLKAEIDLNCLNSSKGPTEKCSMMDFQGNYYIKENGSFRSVKPWEPFKIKKKKSSN